MLAGASLAANHNTANAIASAATVHVPSAAVHAGIDSKRVHAQADAAEHFCRAGRAHARTETRDERRFGCYHTRSPPGHQSRRQWGHRDEDLGEPPAATDGSGRDSAAVVARVARSSLWPHVRTDLATLPATRLRRGDRGVVRDLGRRGARGAHVLAPASRATSLVSRSGPGRGQGDGGALAAAGGAGRARTLAASRAGEVSSPRDRPVWAAWRHPGASCREVHVVRGARHQGGTAPRRGRRSGGAERRGRGRGRVRRCAAVAPVAQSDSAPRAGAA
jgi:hypothetical protein